ncbi:MAG TPA: cell division topological specificity factor MinE [Campylobacterales bacterium]|nr:cell division topological specificity factor MinE [Campylobacterales bacterium]
MTLFERIFGQKKASAGNAKARLKVMLATERADCHIPYLEDLKREILEVVKKYTGSTSDVNIKTEKNDDVDMLELEIALGKN